MDYAAALTVWPNFIHDFRAVYGAEGLTAKKVFPDVVNGSATRSCFSAGALKKQTSKER